MQADRSDAMAGYDTFTCLRCDLVLTYRRPPVTAGTRKAQRELP
ncbi:hypothetical protein [Pseudorhodoplanes sp.]